MFPTQTLYSANSSVPALGEMGLGVGMAVAAAAEGQGPQKPFTVTDHRKNSPKSESHPKGLGSRPSSELQLSHLPSLDKCKVLRKRHWAATQGYVVGCKKHIFFFLNKYSSYHYTVTEPLWGYRAGQDHPRSKEDSLWGWVRTREGVCEIWEGFLEEASAKNEPRCKRQWEAGQG